MAPPSPPVRVTRARAAAALAKDAAKTAPISAASSRVTKPKNKKDQPAASVKAAAAKRRATAKPKAARGSTATNATESSLAKSRRPGDRKRKAPAGAAADDADDLSLSEEDRPAKKQRGQAAKATKPESQQEPNSISNTGSEASSSAHTASSSSAPVTATSPSAATTIPAVDSDPRVTRARSTRPAALAARTALKQQASTRSRQSVASGASASANAEKSDKKTKSSRPARNIITTTYGTTPTPGLRSAVSRPLQNASQNPKKTVTFEEPANEDNLAGMPAKAVHNSDISDISDISDSSDDSDDSDGAAGPSTQAAVAVKNEKKVLSPLGPQKDGWIRPFSQDNGSDDELATAEKTPLKSPRQQLKDELLLTEKRQEDVSPYLAASSSVLSNAPRRLPMSPFKDAFKSPAKRVEGVSPFLTSSIEPKGTEPSSAPSLLQSPAKRPRMPLSVLSQANNEVAESYKVSLLKSPAKHPSQLMKKAGDEDIESPISKAPFPGPLFTKEPIAELQKKPTPKEREVPDHEDITPERSMDEAAKTLQQSTAPVEDAEKENADVSTTQINDQQMINDQPGTGKLEAPVVDAREQITSEQAPLVNHEPEHNKPEIEEGEASDLDVEEQSVLTSTAENDQQIDDQLATGEANASVLGAEEQLMIPTIKDDQSMTSSRLAKRMHQC
ncbi:hypothetical protein GGR50DRAFT_445927 [Xylaria sp. CBS 124048]|nr:hypothetical protein GGR50DRAFT_445927 [Xylaria sp. CBS 124048]